MEVVSTEYIYQRIEEIGVGQGRNSRVYRSHDPRLGGDVAVKEIPKANFARHEEYFGEAKAMHAADCPNVVPIRLASDAADHVCLVMPYLTNGSLQSRIAIQPISPVELVRIGQGVLKGLSQIHIRGLLHFDVKPSNVLFSSRGEAMVADFGQSRFVGDSGSSLAPRMYTAAIPPEVFTTHHGTVETDIYQAGMTFYRALNGDKSFQEQCLYLPNDLSELKDVICNGDFPDRDAFLPHVPRWLKAVVLKSLSVDPSQRYRSATEFANALGRNSIPTNWQPRLLEDGGIEWTATKKKGRDLKVLLRPTGRRYAVEVYTIGKHGVANRKGQDVYWRCNKTLKQAMAYLKQLFLQLV